MTLLSLIGAAGPLAGVGIIGFCVGALAEARHTREALDGWRRACKATREALDGWKRAMDTQPLCVCDACAKAREERKALTYLCSLLGPREVEGVE